MNTETDVPVTHKDGSEVPVSIIRAPRPDGNYTVLRNSVLRDDRLSFRARGILVAILSRPDNWRTDSDSLSRAGKEGRDAIRTALKELEEFHYLYRFREQDKETGQWKSHCYVYDQPENGKPVVGKPNDGKPVAIQKTDNKDCEEGISLASASGDPVITARDIAAKWIDTFIEVHDSQVPQSMVKRVAQSAKQLLGEGFDPEVLMIASAEAATGGHANLASSVTYLSAKNKKQPKGFAGIREFLEQ
jgi:hypothetical protein